MKRNDLYTSGILGLLGLYIAYEGYRLKLGSLSSPKSGLLIFGTGIVLLGLSIALFLKTLLHLKEAKEDRLWGNYRWVKGLKYMTALFTYALLFKWLGFLLATFVLLLFLLKGIEPQRWSIAILLSVITIGVCYLIFGVLLECQFPEGILKVLSFW